MKVIWITAGTLFFVFMGLFTTKQWGKAQVFIEYKHPFFSITGTEPILFLNPVSTPEKANEIIQGTENLYLNVAFTEDHILVLPLEKFKMEVRYYPLAEIKSKVIVIDQVASHLQPPRKLIFNLVENTRVEQEVFMEAMKKIGLEKGENFLVRSEYEAPIRALKELAPALVFGTTQPEILKLVAMQSMYILEAASLRADVLVYPLKIKNQNFYTEEIVAEMQRRHKKIIVGPVTQSELAEARQINPFGIILNP
ncbi:MAG: hypothetical protein ACXVAX_12255 [Pseudobdellovibrio sp.]